MMSNIRSSLYYLPCDSKFGFSSCGAVTTYDQVRERRMQEGYCLECTGNPVQLYQKKFLLKRDPLNIPGKSRDGQCLLCHPEERDNIMQQQQSSAKYPTKIVSKVPTDGRNDSRRCLPSHNDPDDYSLANATISEISSLIQDMGDSHNELIFDVLLQCTRDNRDSVAIQEYCLGRLSDLLSTTNVDYQHSSGDILATSDAPKEILQTMEVHSHNTVIQESGGKALWHLLCADNQAQHKNDVQTGVVA